MLHVKYSKPCEALSGHPFPPPFWPFRWRRRRRSPIPTSGSRAGSRSSSRTTGSKRSRSRGGFDYFYSSHAIRTHDLDGDGALGPEEVRSLRADSFDPLARFDYHVHVWVGDGRREGHEVDRFSARVEDERLVLEFSVPVAPPADPGEGPVVVSLLDSGNEVDFRFAESNFILADGEVKTGCRFRVARGRGEQSGHPRPVTLTCGG